MTTAVIEAVETGHTRGHGELFVYDADRIRHAIDRGTITAPYIDDRESRDVQIAKSIAYGLRTPQSYLDGEDLPGVWVPSWGLSEVIPADETIDAGYNLFCTAGVTRVWNLFTNQGAAQAFDATHTRLAVGNGTGTPAAANTDLFAAAGSVNRWFNLVNGVGTVSTNTLQFASTFATGDGNFVWNEWASDNGTAGANTVTAPLFNHAGSVGGLNLITKTSSAAVTLTITYSIA